MLRWGYFNCDGPITQNVVTSGLPVFLDTRYQKRVLGKVSCCLVCYTTVFSFCARKKLAEQLSRKIVFTRTSWWLYRFVISSASMFGPKYGLNFKFVALCSNQLVVTARLLNGLRFWFCMSFVVYLLLSTAVLRVIIEVTQIQTLKSCAILNLHLLCLTTPQKAGHQSPFFFCSPQFTRKQIDSSLVVDVK